MSDLEADLQSGDLETVYDALIAAGKQGRQELRARIEPLLASEVPDLREASLKVVAFYWRLPEHRATAIRMLREDPDRDVRTAAAMALGGYDHGPGDVLVLLVSVALDRDEDESVRDLAYSSALVVAGVSKQDYPMARTRPGFEARADWKLLERQLVACGAEVPERLRALAGGD